MLFNEALNLLKYMLGLDVKNLNSPAITICCVHINSKVKQELDNVVVPGTHCVV